VNIFGFQDYRKFLLTRLEPRSTSKRGELTRLAKVLGVNSSYLSQIIHGSKNLSVEQAFLIAEDFGLTSAETEFFIELVHLQRATKANYRKFILGRVRKLQMESLVQKGIPPIEEPLDERSKGTFYSNWYYTAIQLLSGIHKFQTSSAIASRLNLNQDLVDQVLRFLVSVGLCIQRDEKTGVGPRKTHLDRASPFVSRHHMNWRIKGMEFMPRNSSEDYFFTAPMRIDERTSKKIRAMLAEVAQHTNQMIDSAGDEKLVCLNIDWFEF
jgi:uncharacterized protein (TIGR02147 family)